MHIARPRLRSQFGWTLAGNVVQGASQWAILSLIAKLGSTEMLGQYALYLALTLPVAMLAHLNLRAVLATDIKGDHPFGDYFIVRMAATGAGFLAILGVGVASGLQGQALGAMLLVGSAFLFDNVSDLYYGWMQRQERMDWIATSMIVRGILAVSAVAVALWITRSVLAAAAGFALARGTTMLLYDLPRSGVPPLERRSVWPVLHSALPLGIVLMLTSLTANLPRYSIERHLGTRELGLFAAVASFVTVGTTIANALGQSATTRLARLFEQRDLPAFRRLALKLVAVAAALGVAGTLIASVAGDFFLALLYRPEFAHYKGALVAIMIAGTLVYIGVTLGYVLTSTRTFAAQIPLLSIVAGACGLTSLIAVPALGLDGAALALGAAATVQIAGQLLLLRRARA